MFRVTPPPFKVVRRPLVACHAVKCVLDRWPALLPASLGRAPPHAQPFFRECFLLSLCCLREGRRCLGHHRMGPTHAVGVVAVVLMMSVVSVISEVRGVGVWHLGRGAAPLAGRVVSHHDSCLLLVCNPFRTLPPLFAVPTRPIHCQLGNMRHQVWRGVWRARQNTGAMCRLCEGCLRRSTDVKVETGAYHTSALAAVWWRCYRDALPWLAAVACCRGLLLRLAAVACCCGLLLWLSGLLL